jgi:hypothetical protein
MYESSTAEGSTAKLHAPDQVLRCEGSPREKRIRKFRRRLASAVRMGKFRRRLASAVRMVRRTHARDRMPQHGRITAHWNLDSRLQEGQGARDLRQKDALFSQYPRESRSKARTGTGAHNHGTAGNRPCGRSSASARNSWKFCFPKGSQYFNFDDLFSTFRRLGPSRYRRATLAIELGGRSIYLNGLFPISLRFVPSFFLLR